MPLPNEKKESQFIHDLIQSEVANEVIYESKHAEMILTRALNNLETRLEIKFQQSLELQRERIVEDFATVKSNIEYHYLKTDGSMDFPNNVEGDQLRNIYSILTPSN